MIRVLEERPKEIFDLLSNPMPFESTFQTPIEELPCFVSTILAPFEFHQASISTFEVVFEPERTLEMLAGQQIDLENTWEFNLKAEGRESIARLLEALLSDWIDFEFTPAPAPLVIYADHDEFITFYSNDELSLEKLVKDLQASGFELVKDWRRPKGYRQISR